VIAQTPSTAKGSVNKPIEAAARRENVTSTPATVQPPNQLHDEPLGMSVEV